MLRLAGLALLAAVLIALLRAPRAPPDAEDAVAAAAQPPELPSDVVSAAPGRLAKALSFPTLSGTDAPKNHVVNPAPFQQLHRHLEASFPTVYKRLRYERASPAGTALHCIPCNAAAQSRFITTESNPGGAPPPPASAGQRLLHPLHLARQQPGAAARPVSVGPSAFPTTACSGSGCRLAGRTSPSASCLSTTPRQQCCLSFTRLPACPGRVMSHMDVVPAPEGPAYNWTHPPFGGVVADGFIWGRGALDVKVTLMQQLEALSLLLSQG